VQTQAQLPARNRSKECGFFKTRTRDRRITLDSTREMLHETEKLEVENDDAEAIHAEVAASPRSYPRPDLLRGPFDIRSLALTGLFVLAVFYTMYFMRAVLLPLVLALLLSYLLRPLVRTLARARITPLVGAALVLLSLVGAIAYAVSFLATPAAGWIEKAPYSLQQLRWKLLPLKQPIESVAKASGEIEKLATSDNPQAKSAIEVKRHPITDALYVQAPELIVNTVMLLILLYFLLASDGVFLTKLIKLLPTLSDKKRAVSIANEIEAHVSRYLLTVTLINVSLGVAVGTAVGFLGLRNPIMWGAMVAMLNFVPYLGALTGIICMTLGAVLSFDNLGYALVFPTAYLSLAILEGNFITPLVMGRSLTLNPVMVLLSLIFWGWMWGVAGVILAVPILAAFKIFCAHLRPLEPMAEFLS
jgi:predicted PurR-regulated permease PerM